MTVTDRSPESAPIPPLPHRRPAEFGDGETGQARTSQPSAGQPAAGQPAAGQPGGSQPLPRRFPAGSGQCADAGLPQRSAGRSENPAGSTLPRRGSGARPRRAGRHRSLHRISVASDAPALVLAVPGRSEAAADLARYVAETATESCPGVEIKIGYLSGGSETLADALEPDVDQEHEYARPDHLPYAVVVPLLAGPHPLFDQAIANAVAAAQAPVMLAAALGPHPLLAGALHDRLYEVGLARASRARGLNIAAGATGVIVVADRGPQAISDAGVTTVLLASRLAVPASPASLGDPPSIDAAVQRLREAGAMHLAIAPCVIGPETDPAEFAALSAALGAPCSAPLGGHPAIAQLVAVRYGEALARIAVPSH
jgi:hypothetical protein